MLQVNIQKSLAESKLRKIFSHNMTYWCQSVIGLLLTLVTADIVYSQSPLKLEPKLSDHHVHFLSPELIKTWKNLGIPFSKPDEDYNDIEQILRKNRAEKIKLISMAYVYNSGEFGPGSGDVPKLIRAENDYLFKLKKQYPRRVQAYYGIDPLHSGAMTEITRCHEELKLDGIKMHFNASQVYLTVADHLMKVKQIFQFAAQSKIPILLHFDNSHRNFGAQEVQILVDSVLEPLKYVDLQIAHFGTSGGFNNRTKAVLDAFIQRFEDNQFIKKQRIKFDISAVALDKDSEGIAKLSEQEFSELARYCRKLGFQKILFGTDYPLYNAYEYLQILINKLHLSQQEIKLLLRNK